jgi:DNA ligase (NAD+)
VEEFATRSVEFFAYQATPQITPSYTLDLKVLRKHGFNTVFDKDLHQIYPTDGVVFRVDDNHRFYELGFTAKHPRGAYARKERGQCVETTLLSVEWQVGKSGKVTPVAILEPVMVGDAQVSRATLNNPGFIEALDLHIGDRVAIRRAGEIIPEIVYKVE